MCWGVLRCVEMCWVFTSPTNGPKNLVPPNRLHHGSSNIATPGSSSFFLDHLRGPFGGHFFWCRTHGFPYHPNFLVISQRYRRYRYPSLHSLVAVGLQLKEVTHVMSAGCAGWGTVAATAEFAQQDPSSGIAQPQGRALDPRHLGLSGWNLVEQMWRFPEVRGVPPINFNGIFSAISSIHWWKLHLFSGRSEAIIPGKRVILKIGIFPKKTHRFSSKWVRYQCPPPSWGWQARWRDVHWRIPPTKMQ